MKLLKYSHPACTKYDINKSYNLQELQNDLSDEMIKIMFIPINFTWENKVDVDEEKLNHTIDKFKTK